MFISLVVSMNSRQGFDHESCVVTGFRVGGSPEFCECEAVER